MNFGFSEEQEFLRSTARELLEKECSSARVREWMEDERGYAPELWKRLAELGWVGLLIPEEHGGAGLGTIELIVILEEMGRALLPSPFFGNLLGTAAVLASADEQAQKDLLPSVAAGERILTFAITEEAGTEEPDAIGARAEPSGDGFALSGTKLFVPDAQNADVFVVAARTGGPGAAGLSLLLVPRGPGVRVSPLESLDRTRRIAEVDFDRAPARLLGVRDGGWPVWEQVRSLALVALAAEALGGAQKVLDDAVAYAKARVQFGKPIGVNQAIKHKCADMLIQVEGSKSITYYAAWAVGERTDDAALAASMAKAYTSDAYRHCSAENIQIHGGVGFTWEYDCHLYFRRAKAIEVTLGDPAWHRERVARLLDL